MRSDSTRGWRRWWLGIAGLAGGTLLWSLAPLLVGIWGRFLPSGLPVEWRPELAIVGGLVGGVAGVHGLPSRRQGERSHEGVVLMLLVGVTGAVVAAAVLEAIHLPLAPAWGRSPLGMTWPELVREYAGRAFLCLPSAGHAVIHALGATCLIAPVAVFVGWGYNAVEARFPE